MYADQLYKDRNGRVWVKYAEYFEQFGVAPEYREHNQKYWTRVSTIKELIDSYGPIHKLISGEELEVPRFFKDKYVALDAHAVSDIMDIAMEELEQTVALGARVVNVGNAGVTVQFEITMQPETLAQAEDDAQVRMDSEFPTPPGVSEVVESYRVKYWLDEG